MRFFNEKSGSRSEWFAASALSVAMFSVGFSVSAVACSAKKTEPPGAQATASAVQVAPPVSSVAPVPSAAVVASAPAPVAAAAPTARPASKREIGRLGVKRFVVASAIEKREPVLVESVPLASQPVFAFAELENPGSDEQRVRVTFEREGARESVGHVELPIPGSSKRWRTWAQTKLIDAPGKWSAVLRDEQGNELARTPFEVTL